MNCHIRFIGVVDKRGKTHAVAFNPGVNVITGKSSTGKSALIEIFDFCFGSSDFTVPKGVITASASIYFVVLAFEKIDLVLGRRPDDTEAFLREEAQAALASGVGLITKEYFSEEYFKPIDDYKKEIGRYLGITVTDVDEDPSKRTFTGRKSSTPSIRSLTSFMLQHQNLVANKHAIFYRFDEREKREQVIEHFKVFAGFADQRYFNLSQELHEREAQRKRLELAAAKEEFLAKEAESELEATLSDYLVTSGMPMEIDIAQALRNPAEILNSVRNFQVKVVPNSSAHAEARERYLAEKTTKTAHLRKLQHKLTDVRSSISFAKKYTDSADNTPVPTEAAVDELQCPFCLHTSDSLKRQANQLQAAIGWLNEELARSPYLLASFEENERKLVAEIVKIKSEIEQIEEAEAKIADQVKDLAAHRTQLELTMRAKFKIEQTLERYVLRGKSKTNSDLEAAKNRIMELKALLKSEYDIETKLDQAEEYINEQMRAIGSRFEFEYKPINLHFSLRTFDLWHQDGKNQVFLRSMGSGANWLYSHITLFLALNRYFCKLGNRGSIPPVLFFDQPSQVYFPSTINDAASAFSRDAILNAEGGSLRKRTVDQDLQAVTDLFDELVRFCKETKESTGQEPQIIVTDHADGLKLAETDYELLVAGRRWRNRGFIIEEGDTNSNAEVTT